MKDHPAINIAAGLAILASATAILMSCAGFPPRVDTSIHKEIGRALAEEALRLRGPTGAITLIIRDTRAFPQPAADVARAAFERELRRSGASVAVVHALQEDPLRPIQVPPGDFFELIRRAAVGDAIVSFMGPPLLTDEQRSTLGTVKPKIVAFCPGNMPRYIDLGQLAEWQLLQAAVLERAEKLTPSAATAKREGFADLYRRVEGSELAQLLKPNSP